MMRDFLVVLPINLLLLLFFHLTLHIGFQYISATFSLLCRSLLFYFSLPLLSVSGQFFVRLQTAVLLLMLHKILFWLEIEPTNKAISARAHTHTVGASRPL